MYEEPPKPDIPPPPAQVFPEYVPTGSAVQPVIPLKPIRQSFSIFRSILTWFVLCLLVASISTGIVEYLLYRNKIHTLQSQISLMNQQINLLSIGTKDSQPVVGQELSWKGFSSNQYSFEFPAGSVTLDTNSGTFTYENIIYSISTIANTGYPTITTWMQGTSLSISNYQSVEAAGHPGYQLITGLQTVFMAGGTVYIVTALSGSTPSNDVSDPVYTHLLATLKIL